LPFYEPFIHAATYNMSKRKLGSNKGAVAPVEKKSKKGAESPSEHHVLQAVQEASVALTGWVPGEYAIGIECKAKTAVSQLAADSPIVGPCKDLLDTVAKFPLIEAQFLDSLTHMSRFANKTREERKRSVFAATFYLKLCLGGCTSTLNRIEASWMSGMHGSQL
jgi:hypothetical protein